MNTPIFYTAVGLIFLIAVAGVITSAILAYKLLAKIQECDNVRWTASSKKEILAYDALKIILHGLVGSENFIAYVINRPSNTRLDEDARRKATLDASFLQDLFNFLWKLTPQENENVAETLRRALKDSDPKHFELKN